MKAKRAVFFAIMAGFVVVGLFAPGPFFAGQAGATEFILDRANFVNPRPLAMGGAFTAVSDDQNLFFTNPAGLAYVGRQQIGFEVLSTSLNNNTIRAINFFSDNRDTFEDLNNLSDEEQAQFYDDVLNDIGGDRSEAQAYFPIYVLLPASEGSVRPHLGFGFFAGGNSNFLTFNGASGIPIAELNMGVQYTGIASAAYSWDTLLPGKLTAGGSVKLDHRRISLNSKSFLALSESEDIDLLSGTSFGVDLGAMYDINDMFRVGATLFDVIKNDFEFTGASSADPLDILRDGDTGKVETSLALGGAFQTDQNFGLLQGILVTLDLQQPFDGDRGFWKSVNAGAETKVAFIKARAGFFEGYLGAGFGLGPLQYAYFSNEVGRYPGARSNYAHAATLAFRFGL